jgi:hypothetical protein
MVKKIFLAARHNEKLINDFSAGTPTKDGN